MSGEYLPLLSAPVTAAIGLLGVALGAWLNSRAARSAERKKWLRDQQLRAYVDYIAATRYAMSLSNNPSGYAEAVAAEKRAYHAIQLLAPQKVLVAVEPYEAALRAFYDAGGTNRSVIDAASQGQEEELVRVVRDALRAR